ncbi:hypothetical protein N7507_000554 [Penicillium longicatenatum]|nr:hypothetical protein N7507_000554 [Penicillium longicatenatum]
MEEYPRSVNELNRTEVRLLTEILHSNNTTVSQIQQVQTLIRALPKRLHRQQVSLSGLKIKPSELCDLHRLMNADVLRDILNLVQREVTRCFQPFDRHPQHVMPTETYILNKLRALKGMWTKPVLGSSVAAGAWPYQINGCAACMLGQIAVQKEIVLLLRVVLQSRTRTGRTHRPRRLMMFVDECMNRFYHEDTEEIFLISSNLAYRMKATRKACSKARGQASRKGLRPKDGGLENVPETSAAIDGQDGAHVGDRVKGSQQNVPTQGTRVSMNTEAEWTAPSVPGSSGSIYASFPAYYQNIEQSDDTHLHLMRYEISKACNEPFYNPWLGEEVDRRDQVDEEESKGSEDERESSHEASTCI